MNICNSRPGKVTLVCMQIVRNDFLSELFSLRQTSNIQIGTPRGLSTRAGSNAGVQSHVRQLRKRGINIVMAISTELCLLYTIRMILKVVKGA